MPRSTPGYRTMSVEVRDELADALKALAIENGRTLREELNHAIERHLGKPPRMVTPKLPAAEAVPIPPGKPGRKPKSDAPADGDG